MNAFGLAPASIKKMFQEVGPLIHGEGESDSLLIIANPSHKSYIHLQSEWFKVQLLTGDKLSKLQEAYHGHLKGLWSGKTSRPPMLFPPNRMQAPKKYLCKHSAKM